MWGLIGFYVSLGFILPAGVIAGYILGFYLDRWLNTTPVLSVVLGFLGAVGGFVEILRLLARAEKHAGGGSSNSGPDAG